MSSSSALFSISTVSATFLAPAFSKAPTKSCADLQKNSPYSRSPEPTTPNGLPVKSFSVNSSKKSSNSKGSSPSP